MGGDALKNCVVRRFKRDEYFELLDIVTKRIEPLVKELYVPRKLGNKETFGDLDLIYLAKDTKTNMRKLIEEAFPESKEIVSNYPAVLFEFKELQIDLCFCSEEDFPLSKLYLEFGDAGRVMGMMAANFGFRFGSLGVFVDVVSDEDNKTQDVLGKLYLSKDPKKIWEFYGLDLEGWLKGFANEEECCEYLVKSKFFLPYRFREKVLDTGHDNKKVKQRPFMAFFEGYVKTKFPDESLDPTESERKENKLKYKKYAIEYFGKTKEYEEFKKSVLEKRSSKKGKLDGDLMGVALGLGKEELGKFIKAFKTQFTDFDKYLEEKSSEAIMEDAIFYMKTVYSQNYIEVL